MKNRLLPNEDRARIAIVVLWVVLFLDILNLIADYFQYNLLTDIENGIGISPEAINTNDSSQRIIAILGLIALIISGITFIRWFRRAYNNLGLMGERMKHSEGWAAGSWFVPFLCLYMPFEMMSEMYRKTKGLLADGRSTKFMGWWWALWLISNIIGSISARLIDSESVSGLKMATIFSMLHALLNILAALLSIKLIREYSEMEKRLPEAVIEND